MSRTSAALLVCLLCSISCAADANEWISMFDGTFDGWKRSENRESWQIEDGALVCKGPRSHLFYVGNDEPFTNFEFECEVMTTPGSNSGIYFHTDYQETGWPKWGLECQVNITHRDPIKSGSLYGVRNISSPPAKDNEWYTTNIRVEGRHVVVKINNQLIVDYTEPDDQHRQSNQFPRLLGRGTFALQAHDPKSVVYFRNLRVRPLP